VTLSNLKTTVSILSDRYLYRWSIITSRASLYWTQLKSMQWWPWWDRQSLGEDRQKYAKYNQIIHKIKKIQGAKYFC